MSPVSDINSDINTQSQNDDLVWRALADPVRRKILDALVDAPLRTGDLVARFSELCRTAVMKHLDVLAAADLVLVRRDGRFRWNSLNSVPIERVCQRWVQAHVRPLASAMNRRERATLVHGTGNLPGSIT